MNKQEKSAEQKFHELIYDALTNEDPEEIYETTPEKLRRYDAAWDVGSQLNQFAQQAAESMEENLEDRKRFLTNPKVKRLMGMVAVFMLVFMVAGAAIALLSPPVDADKNQRKVAGRQGDTDVISEEFYEGDQIVGYKEWETTSWEDIGEYRKFLPELLVPDYLPEGCAFERLGVKKHEDGKYYVQYQFTGEGGAVDILQTPESDAQDVALLEGYEETRSTERGDLQICSPKKSCKVGQIVFGGQRVRIYGELKAEEMVRIAEGLE